MLHHEPLRHVRRDARRRHSHQSYCGAQIFEAVGLQKSFDDKYFYGTASNVEGIGIFEVAEEAWRMHRQAFGDDPVLHGMLDAGLSVSALSAAYPGRTFEGIVRTVDSRVDPVSRSVTVRAELANDEGLLKPGMFMTVRLAREAAPALVVPEAAIVPERGKVYVFVVEGGKVERREVATGRREPGRVELVRGRGRRRARGRGGHAEGARRQRGGRGRRCRRGQARQRGGRGEAVVRIAEIDRSQPCRRTDAFFC